LAHQRDWVGYEQAATYWTTLWMFGYVIIGLIYGGSICGGLAVTLVTIAVCQIGGVVFDAVMTLLSAADGGERRLFALVVR